MVSVVVKAAAQTIRDLAPTVRVRTIVATVTEDGTITIDKHFAANPSVEAKAAGMPTQRWVERGGTCSQAALDAFVDACTGTREDERPEAYKTPTP